MRIRHTPRIVSVALVALCVLDLAVLPAQGLTHEEKVAAATRLLEMYDADKSGALTMEELGRLAGDKTGAQHKRLGLNTEQFTDKFGARIEREGGLTASAVFARLDENNDGHISKSEMAGVTQYLGSSEVR